MYTSKSATLIGACCSTLTPPSPRPMPNTARPFERPCTVAIASAASIGCRIGIATAVATLSLVVAAAATARTA